LSDPLVGWGYLSALPGAAKLSSEYRKRIFDKVCRNLMRQGACLDGGMALKRNTFVVNTYFKPFD
jgi:hypothetical protein